MEPITLENELSKLMSAHGVEFHAENEWIVPFNKLPAMRASWFPRESSGLLEVEVLLDDKRIINECFAGIGSGKEGIRDALQNFCVNSFHVLLAALWDLNDPNQVLTEQWDFEGKAYTAFIGNFGTRGSKEADAEIPQGIFEAIEKAIRSELFVEDLSWFRCFFCDVSGVQTFESLKNNEVWEAGIFALKTLPWAKSNGYYSVRNFIVIRKNA